MTGPETAELEAVDAALAGRPVAPEHRELAELVARLHAERPEPTLAWTSQLDRRAAAGFPGRPRRRLRLSLAGYGPLAGVAATVLLVIGVSVAVFRDSDVDTFSQDASTGVSSGGATAESQVAPSPPQPSGDPGSDARDRRSVERSAELTLGAPPRAMDQVASEAARVAADLGGFVASSRVTSSSGGRLDLRVPSRRLDTAIERLSALAAVRELSRASLDITSMVVSARERLADARAERRSLLGQLEDAATLNETQALRARLRMVSREIASARARVERVDNRARFANVAVTLVADRGASDEGGAWTPGDALRDAVRVLEVIAGVALIALAVAAPLLLALALLWAGRRGLTRRRRERALDMA